jgi:hypothetical protein
MYFFVVVFWLLIAFSGRKVHFVLGSLSTLQMYKTPEPFTRLEQDNSTENSSYFRSLGLKIPVKLGFPCPVPSSYLQAHRQHDALGAGTRKATNAVRSTWTKSRQI